MSKKYAELRVIERYRIARIANIFWLRKAGPVRLQKDWRDLAGWYDTDTETVLQLWVIAHPGALTEHI